MTNRSTRSLPMIGSALDVVIQTSSSVIVPSHPKTTKKRPLLEDLGVIVGKKILKPKIKHVTWPSEIMSSKVINKNKVLEEKVKQLEKDLLEHNSSKSKVGNLEKETWKSKLSLRFFFKNQKI
ncbi:hypothetical protein L1987_48387 [Smallanthus sonchifolius]|uniref:Uncharacterized protein n=1 Tax=Smallanthus sonchifolius TaxID=185202 RepID=A0ACB9FRU9_9ASTR|nr:hypothetical protein L1987_48387 [Smallanthus sonchifolius]